MSEPSYQPPPGYAQPATGYLGQDGPPGRVRGTGVSILLFVVTFGIYGYVYNYQVHEEMKRHSGRGIGGGIALLLTFLAGVAMPFLTPHEVGNLYDRKGQRPPVKALTGLWTIGGTVAAFVPFVIGFVALLANADTDPVTGEVSELSAGSLGTFLVACFLAVVVYAVGAIIGFAKTNNALNQYWRAVGVAG